MKTEKQIKKEIEALKTIRPNVIPMSLFGDDNLAGVDAQIAVLENDWDEDDVYDEFEKLDRIELIEGVTIDAGKIKEKLNRMDHNSICLFCNVPIFNFNKYQLENLVYLLISSAMAKDETKIWRDNGFSERLVNDERI